MLPIAAAPASRPSPVLPSDSAGTYHLVSGDTLSEIAQRHGTSVAALMQANPQITDPDLIYADNTLCLPEGSADAHVVRTGETLSQLARGHDADVAALMRFNSLGHPGLLHAGSAPRMPARPKDGQTAAAAGPLPTGEGSGHWMDIARGEMGQREIAGSCDNRRIVEYHRSTGLRARDDETPWCSSFVNWTLRQAGHQGTGSAAAISWKDWGQRVDGLPQGRKGDVVVLRNESTGQNHVGFLERAGSNSVTLLGGNQSNRVKLSTFNLGSYDVIAVRRPTSNA